MTVRVHEVDTDDVDDNRPGCAKAWAAAAWVVGIPLGAVLGPVIVLKLAELIAGLL